VIGDVHGELEALHGLLESLGYDARGGAHPEGRQLVFVGDLVDRGPDSPGVLRLVKRLVEQGSALCVVGNHELNALRDDPHKRRPGEDWWYQRRDARGSRIVSREEKREELMPFLESLPLALERDDLRVVHACWHDSIEDLRRADAVLDAFRRRERALAPQLADLARRGEAALARAGLSAADLGRRRPEVPLVPEYAVHQERKQMGNPVKIATSGVERVARRTFYASDKWRMVERVAWWQDYAAVPVVMGHYWRRYHPDRSLDDDEREADLFGGVPPGAWLGPEGRVMCIDYSVGYRHKERSAGRPPGRFATCLAALRIPEWVLVFDDGRPPLDVGPPGPSDDRA